MICGLVSECGCVREVELRKRACLGVGCTGLDAVRSIGERIVVQELVVVLGSGLLLVIGEVFVRRVFKMHASNLLKAVLKPRTLSAASRQRSVSDGGRERRSLSPDNRLPPPVLAARKAASVAPVVKKMTCMCSPTNHPGSFRCRYHREMAAKAASAAVSFPRGRSPAPARPSTKSVGGDAQSNIIFSEVNRTLPGRASHISRSPTGRTSRLQKMTMGTGFEEEEEELTCSISDE